ncbi:MAG: pyridoxal-phosphate dependent enzyme [Ruminiclostridium sp.]|nr:pyridoxal-phosphate dependent enzyme [Ruminiclostridium sp.]
MSVRKFELKDVPYKVAWINDPENNRYLHYDLPLEIEKTELWYERTKDRTDRYDAVIEVDNVPVGLIGLLSIDEKSRKAEYYITIGDRDYLHQGVAVKATKLLLEVAFGELKLNKVFLFTECENHAAVRAYERIGFKREGVVEQDIFSKGRYIDRYIYGITRRKFYRQENTPVCKLGNICGNEVYMKREDLISFSFGGNKARKAKLFFEEIDLGQFDCVVTYGSSSSNHCRVVSNMAAARGMKCYIISPLEGAKSTYNSKLMDIFGAERITCPVEKVSETIAKTIQSLQENGRLPYFIPGGGHGNVGTQAYLDCYEEIRQFEKENGIWFDYIFFASGTGTTQAGLVCGQILNRDKRKIVGISIARKSPYGRDIVLESIREYLSEVEVPITEKTIDDATIFIDDYVETGYGASSEEIQICIMRIMTQYGIPLDTTYTGKAFAGMLSHIKQERLKGKTILFIHTGGTPLFFDALA